MAKSKDLTLSDVGFGNKVLINGHVYTYKGQDKRRTSGGTKTVYIFKMVDTSKVPVEFWEKRLTLRLVCVLDQLAKKGVTLNLKFIKNSKSEKY